MEVITKFNLCECFIHFNKVSSIGIIFTEAVTNAIQHAFNTQKKGAITINLTYNSENTCFLEIIDNGDGFDLNLIDKSSSLGIMLINSIPDQIDAKSQIISNTNGTTVQLTFPLK